jgi:hypothetical protein
MANYEHVNILKQGVEAWNKWRVERAVVKPDLIGAYLSETDISGADLSFADLGRAFATRANLTNVDLSGAVLSRAELSRVKLCGANLTDADLSGTELSGADLSKVIFHGAILLGTNFSRAQLLQADLTGAYIGNSTFADTDLSEVKGLERVNHGAPSSIGIDTLYKSGGRIPKVFLRGCGVPDDFIAFIPSHFGIQQAIQFYSCFISYSNKDEEFARRLYSRMRDEKLRVWFAPEDIKGGEKLHEQLERAIQIHDRLLIVLSEESMQSEWVISEIRKARDIEINEGRRKLFPIMLVDYRTVKKWKCFDADTGKDLAREVREYFIPDFSNWKDHDAFEKGFSRLLRDLRAEEAKVQS